MKYPRYIVSRCDCGMGKWMAFEKGKPFSTGRHFPTWTQAMNHANYMTRSTL